MSVLTTWLRGATAAAVLAGAAALLAAPTAATAAPVSSLSASWTTLAFGHPDSEKSIDGLATGLVQSALGPNGLPVRSALSAAASPSSSNNITDVDPVTGEILWWTPGRGVVAADAFYPTTVALPFSQPSNLFPGGGSSNGNPSGYTAATFSGLFNLASAGTITLTLGADDDAWVFIDGALAVDLGGVKALTPAPFTSMNLAAGDHRLDLFFADRHVVQSGLVFSADVTLTPVPEPASLALFGAGLLGLGFARRRRAARATA